jgi:gliding motility-associated-like protein
MKKSVLKLVFGFILMSYGFFSYAQTYTFTNCGATGRFGPTLAMCNGTYGPGVVNVTTQGIQLWTVPVTGPYSVEVWGAQGGSDGGFMGGRGAYVKGEFNLVAGTVYKIVVGQTGTNAGGGGGSHFATNTNVPQISAGGGSGTGNGNGGNGYITPNGAGGGGAGDGAGCGTSGGGGFYGNGVTGGTYSTGGLSFVNNAVGGLSTSCDSQNNDGGFGGGGAGGHLDNAGGGGGYTGGFAKWIGIGQGGSSYNIGTNQVNTSGVKTGHGQVVITLLCNPATPPSITCPANISVNNTVGNCSAIVTYTAPTDPCAVVTQTAGLASGSTFPVGTTTNTFQATNGAGTVTCSFTVTVVDAEAPAITCPGAITINTDAGQCTSTAAIGTATGTDNCGSPTITNNAPASFPIGNTTVTWTATDGASNTTTCTQVVTVVDAEAPAITCPANITVNNDAGNCSAVVNYTAPVGTDNCTGATTALTAGLASGSAFPVGVNTVTYTVTDGASNTTSCSFTVTVVDAEAPAITCPANITVNNDAGMCDAVVTYTVPVGTDNCTGATTALTAGLASGSAFPVGITTVTYTVTDGSSNTTSCSFTVTVVDTTLPTITCPSNIIVANDPNMCSAVVTYTAPTGTDNCTGATTAMTAGLGSGATFPVGTTTETYTVTDAANNTTSCSFTVTVVDAEAPVITCPANITVSNDSGMCDAVVTYTAPVGTDNCTGATTALTAGLASGSAFPVGTTTVTYTVTDGSSNTTSCSFTVTVVDAEAPVISCPANITVSNDSGMCDAVVTYTAPVGTDNCSGATTALTVGLASGSTFPVGITTVTYTVTDGSSNTTSCSFTVTVVDTTLPTITCPSNIIVANDPNMCSAVVTYTAPTGTDNCTGAVTNMSSGLASGSTFPVGVTTITYLVTDASNNVDSCSFTVTVADSVAPVATCQNFTLYLDNTGNVTLIADSIDNGSTDDCAIDTLIASPATFTCNEVGANNVTLYVYDAYGNVDSCTAVVTVIDTIAPTATCQNISAYLDNTGNITITAIDIDGGSTDACGIDSISISPAAFTCNEIGANSVTLIVTDVNGNVDSCQATVTVMDTLAPTVSCPSNQNVKTDITCIYEIGDYTNLASNVTDNCDNNSVIITQTPIAGTMVTADIISKGQGQTTVTIIVQDQSGNIDSCDFIVDVECGAELSIPNVFTPNGDGKNDVWNIDGLDDFPDVTVSVFNRWGDLMFESDKGYTKSWDGTYNGTASPAATYYYIIVLGSGEEGITGTINIIR